MARRRGRARVALTRSQIMGRIGSRDTGPELALRRALRQRGIGYRKNVRGLPGTPDVVLHGAGLAVFVHGCFWHRHPGCPRATTPKSGGSFWTDKFAANERRDRRRIEDLRRMGWSVGVVWECETGDPADLALACEAILEIRSASRRS